MNISNKIIVKKKIVDLSGNKVWTLWSTHEGLKKFFGRDNKIELKIGGEFEIYFLLNNEYGQKGSEGCKVLSFLPGRMISFSWNVPPKFEKLRKSEYKTWVVVIFNEIGPNKTEISLNHYGWPDEEEWDLVFNYFDSAWEEVLEGITE